jgi:hypothetical protein
LWVLEKAFFLQAGGIGDHDLEQKAVAALRLERVAAMATAHSTGAGTVNTSSSSNALHGGNLALSSELHDGQKLGFAQGAHVSTGATIERSDTQRDSRMAQTRMRSSRGDIAGLAALDALSVMHDVHAQGDARKVALRGDYRLEVDVAGVNVEKVSRELAPPQHEGGTDVSMEAQAGTAAPVLRP